MHTEKNYIEIHKEGYNNLENSDLFKHYYR